MNNKTNKEANEIDELVEKLQPVIDSATKLAAKFLLYPNKLTVWTALYGNGKKKEESMIKILSWIKENKND